MIDSKLVDFIHAAEFWCVGTVDARLKPHGAHVMGGRINGETGQITIFIPDALAGQAVEDMKATRRAAVNIAEGVHHETYQLKGEVLDVHPLTAQEGAVLEIYMAKLGAALVAFGLPVQDWKFPPMQPCQTAVIKVTDIYFQTPGPRAGERIGP